MSLPLYVEPSPQMSTPCSRIAWTSIVPVTARPSGVVLKYVLPALETWKAPHCSATSPSWTSCVATVDELGRLGAVVEGALADVRDVVLVDLAEIGRERVRDPAFLPDPGDGDRGVQPARERDADALADRQRLEDAAHRSSVVAGHRDGCATRFRSVCRPRVSLRPWRQQRRAHRR